MCTWEKDLSILVTEAQRNSSQTQIHRCSLNAKHNLMQGRTQTTLLKGGAAQIISLSVPIM